MKKKGGFSCGRRATCWPHGDTLGRGRHWLRHKRTKQQKVQPHVEAADHDQLKSHLRPGPGNQRMQLNPGAAVVRQQGGGCGDGVQQGLTCCMKTLKASMPKAPVWKPPNSKAGQESSDTSAAAARADGLAATGACACQMLLSASPGAASCTSASSSNSSHRSPRRRIMVAPRKPFKMPFQDNTLG